MGIATPPVPPILPHFKAHSQHQHQQSPILPLVLISQKSNCNRSSSCSSSMSQDYHQAAGIFSFSNNGFERSPVSHQEQQQQQQHHVAQQIRRDKLRIQASGGYEPTPPSPLVGIEEEEAAGLNPVYESAGMLSEMFNFPSGGGAASTATELMDQPLQSSYHRTQLPRQQPVTANDQWFSSGNRQGMLGGLGPLEDLKNHNNRGDSMAQHHHPHHHQISAINADSAAAMQLFLMNPQPRSPSPTPSHHPPSTSSTLHMLLPNPSGSLQGFNASGPGGAFGSSAVISPQQFTWVPDSTHEGGSTGAHLNNPNDIGRVVEGQGLSLSLSSSLQHLEAAKAEELRMGDGSGLLYYNQGGGSSSGAAQYFKNLGAGQHQAGLHLQGGMAPTHQAHHLGFGSSSSLGMVNVLRNSRYVKAAQELLEEFCSVGRGQFKKSKLSRQNTNPSSSTPGGSTAGAGGGGCGGSSSSINKDLPSLSAAERIEHQRRKVKLLSMLDEVDRRYNHYCEQMQMVVNSFDLVMGFGAAVPYTALAQKAMSRHFRCLKDAIAAQLKHSCELLGEKDGAGTSGITKGETPRLRLLEQSLRQQRAFHQMGMMEQEAWRPQRGLPERSVNILRAWLFEHFLHPYPSDADKHLLARQTGLTRNQVSNWFINARVRLWKPMVEEMYQQETKEEESSGTGEDREKKRTNNSDNGPAQTPMPTTSTTTTGAGAAASSAATARGAVTTSATTTTMPSASMAAGKRSEINAHDNDPSLLAINRQCFSENQARNSSGALATNTTTSTTAIIAPTNICTATAEVAPQPHGQAFHDLADDTCHRGSMVAPDYGAGTGTTSGNANAAAADIGSTIIRFGTTAAGDVSLTLGLRHAGNMPEKSSTFSVRDYGRC